MLVVESNNEGVPFVLANPAAPISQDLHRVAAELLRVERHQSAGRGSAAGADGSACPTRGRSGSSTRASAG